MAIGRQVPVRLVKAIHGCFRRRNFSLSMFEYNDKSTVSPPPLPSSINQKSSQTFKLCEDILSTNSAAPRRIDTQKSHSFEPVDTADFPLPSPPSPATTVPSPPLPVSEIPQQGPGYFHVHAVSITSNMHVTITDHKHNPVVTMSAGRVGYKHAKRRTQEAAYDAAVAAFEKFSKTSYKVEQVEIVLKGFGQGRRGFISAINGQHGDFLRKKVVRVTDATPLVIGGTRVSNKRRR